MKPSRAHARRSSRPRLAALPGDKAVVQKAPGATQGRSDYIILLVLGVVLLFSGLVATTFFFFAGAILAPIGIVLMATGVLRARLQRRRESQASQRAHPQQGDPHRSS